MLRSSCVLALAAAAALVVVPAAHATCIFDTPSVEDGAIVVSFYTNTGGGRPGDDCPVPCTTPIRTQTYSTNTPNYCHQWPGQAGENSANSGQCYAEDNLYSFIQYNSCDCGVSDDTPTFKQFHYDRCAVDVPTSLCARITNFDACLEPTLSDCASAEGPLLSARLFPLLGMSVPDSLCQQATTIAS